jgi:uncharacterized protein (DUF488 family)
VLTIGHSTHPLEEFVSILKAHEVERLVDVRTMPKSRHVPQYNSEALATELLARGIDYVHMKELGGLRHARKDSINIGWRNASFRGYADYMGSAEFRKGIDRLIELAGRSVPPSCARKLFRGVVIGG